MITIWFSDDKQSVMLPADIVGPMPAMEALDLADRLVALLRPKAPQQDKNKYKKQLTPEERHSLVERYCAGEGSAELSREFGVVPRHIYTILNKAGVTMRHNKRASDLLSKYYKRIRDAK